MVRPTKGLAWPRVPEVVGDPIHRFVATAEIKGRDTSLDRTASMTFDIDCWVTTPERAALQSALQTDGTARSSRHAG